MTPTGNRAPARPVPLAAALALACTLALASCSSDDGGPAGDPQEVLATAAQELGETSGAQLSLTTDDLPAGVNGVTSAVGVATDAPAFEGTLEIRFAGNDWEVPVVAVDDTVWAQLPLTPGWSDVDPTEYGAPDPSGLISPDRGFGTLLTATDGVEEGESVRGGVENREVLTTYTGTIPGDVMENVIPSSAGELFEATYLISEEGQLRQAELTGVFYADSEEMTYTVTLTDYGTQKEITAP